MGYIPTILDLLTSPERLYVEDLMSCPIQILDGKDLLTCCHTRLKKKKEKSDHEVLGEGTSFPSQLTSPPSSMVA